MTLPAKSAGSTDRAPAAHYIILACLPAVLSLLNSNWPFLNIHGTDPWYYFGDFIHFPRVHAVLPKYPDERMLWIAPGFVLVRLLGPVWGVATLHWVVYLAGIFCAHRILLAVAGARTALAGAMMLGCSPFYVGPNGWDYPEGLQMACLLLSLATLLPRGTHAPPGHWRVIVSGVAWAGLINTYLGWLMLSPAYAWVLLRRAMGDRIGWRRAVKAAVLAAIGGVAMCLALWAAYAALGGTGFYLRENVAMARVLAKTGNAPWLEPNWWRKPTWLVFPGLAVCVTIGGLLDVWRRRSAGVARRLDLFVFYCGCAAALGYLTLGPGKLLMFDYKTSILVPGAFLTFGLVLFEVPERASRAFFYLVTLLAGALCLAPLARVNLYELADRRWLQAAMLGCLVLAVVIRVWKGPDPRWWAAAMVCFSVLSFGLFPPTVGTPWYMKYDGPQMSRAVARSIQVVLSRTPPNMAPIFWFQDRTDRLAAEFRGVTCSMLTVVESMHDFPRVDVDKKFPAGSRLFVLRGEPSAGPAAQYQLARAGMPAAVRSEDAIRYGEESFYITQMEILESTPESFRDGFEMVAGRPARPQEMAAEPGSDAGHTRFLLRGPVRLEEPGVYQFELRCPRCGEVRFGALEGGGHREWREQSVAPVADAGESVAWFRLVARAGERVQLAIEAPCTGKQCSGWLAGASTTLLRSRTPVQAALFCEHLGKNCSNNLIPNGAFEQGVNRWSGMQGKIRRASNCHLGSCVEFVPLGTAQQYLVQWGAVKLQPGKRYVLSAWVRSGAGKVLRIEYGMWDAGPSTWAGKQDAEAGPQWTQIRFEFVNTSPNGLSPIFWESRGDFGSLFVDEVELQEAAP